MPDRHRLVGVLVVALIAVGLTGCAIEPPPSCGEYALDQDERIPQRAIDCMSAAGADGALRITGQKVDGEPVATTYDNQQDGEILVVTELLKYHGVTVLRLCHRPVSVVDLGECEELHEGD